VPGRADLLVAGQVAPSVRAYVALTSTRKAGPRDRPVDAIPALYEIARATSTLLRIVGLISMSGFSGIPSLQHLFR
jgi:hypothetical protein